MAGTWGNLASKWWVWSGAVLMAGVALAAGYLVYTQFLAGPPEPLPTVSVLGAAGNSTDAAAIARQLALTQKQLEESRQQCARLSAEAGKREGELAAAKQSLALEKKGSQALLARATEAETRVTELGGKVATVSTPSSAPRDPVTPAGSGILGRPVATAAPTFKAPAVATRSTGAAPAHLTAVDGGVAMAVTGFDGLYAAPYPDLPRDGTGRVAKSAPIDLLKSDKAVGLKVEWPMDVTGLPFQITEARDGVAIERTTLDALGQKKAELLGKATFEGGVLRWQWAAFNGANLDTATLENMVRYARFALTGPSGLKVAQVQWIVPQEVSVTLDGPLALLNDWGVLCETRLVLVPETSGSWSEATRKEGTSLQVRVPSGQTATVAIKTLARGIEAWATSAEADLPKRLTQLRYDVGRLELTIKTMEADTARLKSPELDRINKELTDVNNSLAALTRKLPMYFGGVVEPGRVYPNATADDFKLNQQLQQTKKTLEAARDKEEARLKAKATPATAAIEARRADLATKLNELAALEAAEASGRTSVEKVPDFEVQVLGARSNILLARIRVAGTK